MQCAVCSVRFENDRAIAVCQVWGVTEGWSNGGVWEQDQDQDQVDDKVSGSTSNRSQSTRLSDDEYDAILK